MKYLFFAFLVIAFTAVRAQKGASGLFDKHIDIGHPKIAGNAYYDAATKTYTIKGAGYNIWFDRDEFQFLYKKIKGDFIATANFKFTGDAGNAHRKIGWMIRQSVEENAIHASAVEHGDGLTVLQWRGQKGANMRDPEDEIFFPEKNFEVIQLQRIGKKIMMRVGNAGDSLQEVGSHEMTNMPNEALVGLFICSHDPEIIEEAWIWNVRLE